MSLHRQTAPPSCDTSGACPLRPWCRRRGGAAQGDLRARHRRLALGLPQEGFASLLTCHQAAPLSGPARAQRAARAARPSDRARGLSARLAEATGRGATARNMRNVPCRQRTRAPGPQTPQHCRWYVARPEAAQPLEAGSCARVARRCQKTLYFRTGPALALPPNMGGYRITPFKLQRRLRGAAAQGQCPHEVPAPL